MTTTDTDLDLRIRTFKASSSFTPGDICSFSVQFAESVSLPGKYDPVGYMQQLSVDVAGQNVLVVCPGNAGLAVAALRAGASTVVVIEPRPVYHRALPSVSEFASDVIGATFSQRSTNDKLIETFDIVFWTEGLDEVAHPKSLIEQVLSSMQQGGKLYIEPNHGHQAGVLPESINSWRPTREAFVESMKGLADLSIESELEGRSQTRRIYTITNNTPRLADKVQELDKRVQDAMGVVATAPTPKAKVAALDTALAATVEKTEALQAAGILPNVSEKAKGLAAKVASLMTGQEEGEFDSIYEGRASTPKSKKKKAKTRSRRGSKGTKPKP